MKNKLLFIPLILLLLSACAKPTQAPEPPHWTYEGEEGPEHWGDLDASYAACETGTKQSPIDISAPSEKDLANIEFNYQTSGLNILNNGHTVQVNYDAGSFIKLDGARFDLVQFHYHAPSEHEVDGKSFAAELHLVHKSLDGNLAVVGILLEEGAENPALKSFTDYLPAQKSEETKLDVEIDAGQLLPAELVTYRYSGSLTTPPCSEGVNWLVMTSPVQVSAAQLDKLAGLFEHGNNRPIQELNNRQVTEDTTP